MSSSQQAEECGEVCSLSRSDSTGSAHSGQGSPALLLGLTYNPVTGRLLVEVIKGSHFRLVVKLVLHNIDDSEQPKIIQFSIHFAPDVQHCYRKTIGRSYRGISV